MKFGSVKFFKRLIIGIGVFILLLPVVLSVLFAFMYFQQKQLSQSLEEINLALAKGEPLPAEVELSPNLPEYVKLPTVENRLNIPASFDYQKNFPELYTQRPAQVATEGKVCYLTFDDGPSAGVTTRILDTLAELDVKATFFVTGKNSEANEDVLRRAAEEGHTIGVHTYSHEYEAIYASVDAYLEDFEKMHSLVTRVTGTEPTVFRFAGGSINNYSQSIYTQVVAEMVRRGYVFYDWNAAASDAVSGGISSGQVVQNVMNSAAGQDRLIVLMHDRDDNSSTAAALPTIIENLRAQGYTFAALDPTVVPIAFYTTE